MDDYGGGDEEMQDFGDDEYASRSVQAILDGRTKHLDSQGL